MLKANTIEASLLNISVPRMARILPCLLTGGACEWMDGALRKDIVGRICTFSHTANTTISDNFKCYHHWCWRVVKSGRRRAGIQHSGWAKYLIALLINKAGFVKNCGTTDGIHLSRLFMVEHRKVSPSPCYFPRSREGVWSGAMETQNGINNSYVWRLA